VYLLTFPDGKKYVGAKSRKFHPDLDECYLGSGRYLPKNRTRHNCVKVILQIFPTRTQAIDAEIAYIKKHNCVESSDYYNARSRTYDRHGVTKETCRGAKISSEIQIGRNKQTHEYLRLKGVKFKQYTGANRTLALLDADIRRADTIRGTKNLSKGHSGITNNGFVSWYYVTPDGVTIENHSLTKKDFSINQGRHPLTVINMCCKSPHKLIKKGFFKGWIFGNLPKPAITG
jgi:acetyltransferase-like isoleucine patch superfamily enzyme